jgi:hypothetical protein
MGNFQFLQWPFNARLEHLRSAAQWLSPGTEGNYR